ncbi:hypothetical protein [Mesorhizobium japonicum]
MVDLGRRAWLAQLPPGAANVTVYQGSGFDSALSNPIVICRGDK